MRFIFGSPARERAEQHTDRQRGNPGGGLITQNVGNLEFFIIWSIK